MPIFYEIYNFFFSYLKSPTTLLINSEKEELKFRMERSNLKNLLLLNIVVIVTTFILLIIDFIILLNSALYVYPSQDSVFLIHIATLPTLVLFSYLIYYYNFKQKQTTNKHYFKLTTFNVIALLLFASLNQYYELKDYQVGITLIIYMFIIAILLRIRPKAVIIITVIYFITYNFILFLLNLSFTQNPIVYLIGINSILLYLLLSSIISKQSKNSFTQEIILERTNNELSSKNLELKENRSQIEYQNNLLKDSNEKLSRFAYMAAHDLKGPLRTTQNLLNILYSKYNLTFEEEDKPLIEYIMKSSKDLGHLITNLLLFSSLSQNLPDTEQVDVNKVVSKVLESLRTLIEENNTEIVSTSELHSIQGNPNLAYQLFLNFISNGIKFSKNAKNKSIIITSIDLNNGFIQYSIKDFGIGIPKDKQSNVFDMFYKGHSKKEYSGSGIGLSICHKIIKHYNGKVWLESELNKGTTIYFTLSKAI